MENTMQKLQKKVRETIDFATGEITAKGEIPFAITGFMVRGKDGLLFANNQTTVAIGGINRSVGDTFEAMDHDGEEFGLKVKMSIGDSRRKFTPKADVPEAELKQGNVTINV